jgi:predicted transcriptional regulator
LKDSVLSITTQDALRTLKALSNEARLRILGLLQQRPMNISEIARELEVSQPTVTTYINQLEEAGLILTRMQKGANGYGKMCFLIHDRLTFQFAPVAESSDENDITLDMPVGHYSAIELKGPSLLASQSGILASQEDSSRFFHPDRMEADLLFMRDGEVQYLFPYNLPVEQRILRLELSVEACGEVARPPVPHWVILSINNLVFDAVPLPMRASGQESHHMPAWFPHELPAAGYLLNWRLSHHQALFNDRKAGKFNLSDLELRLMRPIQVGLRVLAMDETGQMCGGMALYGRNFGRFDQDLRMRIIYEQA